MVMSESSRTQQEHCRTTENTVEGQTSKRQHVITYDNVTITRITRMMTVDLFRFVRNIYCLYTVF